jgi:hemerythrin-like metal-binding protein
MIDKGSLSLWSAEYGINVAAVDNQHQRLLMMIRQLHESIARGEAGFTVEPQFQALGEYTRFHFNYEEQLMERYRYPGLDRHRESHERLIQQLVQLERDYQSANLGVGVPLGDFFGRWLIDHIVSEDKRCGQFLNSVGIV